MIRCVEGRRRVIVDEGWRPALAAAVPISLFVLGLVILLPLMHHLLATPPGWHYISTASNFFAFNPLLQLAVFAVAVGTAVVVTRLRVRYLPS